MRISDWSSDVCSSDLDIIVARALGDVVEAAVRVLLEPPEGREIILEAVVVAIAEQADAELAVVEQKTAEIALERLDADADRVEVVAVAVVAEMLVDEGFLHPDEMVEAMALLRGTHVEHAPFGHVDIVDVIRSEETTFDVGSSDRRRVGQEVVSTCG